MNAGDTGPRRRGQAQRIYEDLHAAILSRRLRPAAPLSQETLGRIFHAGPSSVRRALQRLAREGAVELAPRRIASVARPDPQRLRQLLETRLLLESDMLRRLAGRLDAQHLAELREMLAAQLRCLTACDALGAQEWAQNLHLRLAQLSANPLLPDLLGPLLERLAVSIALGRGQAHTADSCRQQAEMLEALGEGDAERACACLESYLRGVGERLRFAPPPTTDLRAAFAGKLAIP